MSNRSIAIAGCGPCGLAAALLLARRGERVVMFERFDAPQPIGSGLMIQPTGLAVLAQLGLAEQVHREGARIERLQGMAGERVVLDVGYTALRGDAAMHGIGLHRASLFAALYDAVLAQGIEVRTGQMVTGSAMNGERRVLRVSEVGVSEPFDLVVDALGTRSPLAPETGGELDYGALWATLDWPDGFAMPRDTLSQRYRRSSTMAGILPLGRGGARTGCGMERVTAVEIAISASNRATAGGSVATAILGQVGRPFALRRGAAHKRAARIGRAADRTLGSARFYFELPSDERGVTMVMRR